MDAFLAAAGVASMGVGMTAVFYAAYLEMIHAGPLRWWDRTPVLLPAGLFAIMIGLLLSI